MFEVNDTVQCINDDEPPQSAPPFVIRGRVYTVVKIETKWWPVGGFGPMTIYQAMDLVWVKGLPSETGHFAFRFQKIDKQAEEKKTDISVFKKMLDKQPEKVS